MRPVDIERLCEWLILAALALLVLMPLMLGRWVLELLKDDSG